MQICLVGARGKMGKAVQQVVEQTPGVSIGAKITCGADWQSVDLWSCHVIVDFSSPNATNNLDFFAKKVKLPLVVGSTGHTKSQWAVLQNLAKSVPVFYASNFSVGAYLQRQLCQYAAQLCPLWDTEILEIHHRQKKDAPSGTAMLLAKDISQQLSRPISVSSVSQQGQIGLYSMRGGTEVGEHQVYFFGSGERIQIVHMASSRLAFATGAIRAAQFVCGQAPGFYTMDDLLK